MSEICDLTTAGIRERYAEISYAKTLFEFLNAREPEPTARYKRWREQVKAYITVLR